MTDGKNKMLVDASGGDFKWRRKATEASASFPIRSLLFIEILACCFINCRAQPGAIARDLGAQSENGVELTRHRSNGDHDRTMVKQIDFVIHSRCSHILFHLSTKGI